MARPHRARPNKRAFHALRARVFERDGWKCVHCGFQFSPNEIERTGRHAPYEPKRNAFLELDHVVPYVRGGSWDESNLQALCTQCNRRKWVY